MAIIIYDERLDVWAPGAHIGTADRLSGLRANPWVRGVRGLGLMWGIELADPRTGRPAGELAGTVQARALRQGLILELGGRHECVVRMLLPST